MACVNSGMAVMLRSVRLRCVPTIHRRVGTQRSSMRCNSTSSNTINTRVLSTRRTPHGSTRLLGALSAGVVTGVVYLGHSDQHAPVQCQQERDPQDTSITKPKKRGSLSTSEIPAVYDTYGGVILVSIRPLNMYVYNVTVLNCGLS